MLSFIFLNTLVVAPKAEVKEDMQAVWISTVYNQDWPSVGSRNNVANKRKSLLKY